MNRPIALLVSTLAALLLALAPALAADFVWTIEAVDATRFIEADSKVVGNIPAGERVEILFREGERIRVKLPASSKFGWIDTGKASEVEPGAPPAGEEPTEPAPVEPE